MKSRCTFPRILRAAAAAILAATCLPSFAQRAKTPGSSLDDLAFTRPELRPVVRHRAIPESGAPRTVSEKACRDFLSAEGAGWRVVFDEAAGGPALLEGRGIPWLPGTANQLPALSGESARMGTLEGEARAFLDRYPDLVAAKSEELTLNAAASGRFSDYLDFADFNWTYQGIPVEGARVVFRLNHGNLVQFGQENVGPSIRSLDPTPYLGRESAWEVLRGYLGGAGEGMEALGPGELLVVPVASQAALDAKAHEAGAGLAYRLVYRLTFRRSGVMGTWEGTVDAHTGELLAFRDANWYGRVKGGAFVADQPSPEYVRPFPFADTGSGNANDKGSFSGGSATSTLAGRYVLIHDTCGPISLSASGGDVDFEKSGASDCATPGVGGAGNTRAARTQYYNVDLVRAKALTFLPNNVWLGRQLTDNVNLQRTCNAYWNGSSLNFFASGGGCGNTGELPGVSLHEWGHGLDDNDGIPASDGATGEAYGDITSTLMGHRSCTGAGFLGTDKCGGYGNPCLECTGVRELDYAKHMDPTPAVASQLSGNPAFHCPPSSSYGGPCGYEGHCESALITQSLWDLAARDLPASGMDAATAWQLADAFWFLSRPSASSAYGCDKSALTTDGCGVGNMYSVFRVVDDCDGDLSNGTPHGEALYAAMDRHGIACSSANHSNNGCCGDLAAPTLTVKVEGGDAVLAWSSVVGASSYAVYRNENGCDAGYVRISSQPSSATGFRDEDVPDGLTYNYRVQAVGASAACAGAMSACQSVSAGFFVEINGAPSPGAVPLAVSFSAQGGGGTPPYSYAWDFGDGATGAGQAPTHTYASVGSYPVSVTATDAASQTARATFTVQAVPPPTISAAKWVGSSGCLKVTGSDFHKACQLTIDGRQVWTVWKSDSTVQAKNCGYMLKKGVPVQLVLTNNDDHTVSAPFTYTR